MVRENEGRTALLELSFAFMGVLKLLGLETRLFRRWGMSPRAMRRIGMIETAGAMLSCSVMAQAPATLKPCFFRSATAADCRESHAAAKSLFDWMALAKMSL